MSEKKVTITFHNVEVQDDPEAVFIRFRNGYVVVLPKEQLEGMEVTIEESKGNNDAKSL